MKHEERKEGGMIKEEGRRCWEERKCVILICHCEGLSVGVGDFGHTMTLHTLTDRSTGINTHTHTHTLLCDIHENGNS